MKPFDVKSRTFMDFDKKIYGKGPQFKVGNNVRISKYKNIFAKGYILVGLRKFCSLKSLRCCAMDIC